MAVSKKAFFRDVAKGIAASTKLYKVDAVVHVEAQDDIWFWQQLLPKYRAGRYKFLPATTNEKGNRTTGCTQCLKYKDYLTQKFFICIDSDLRYLLEENMSVEQGILQTYTYSWENHCAFAPKLQHSLVKQTKRVAFDFEAFLQAYSKIVYKPFLFMLYQEQNRLTTFGRNEFKQCISLQFQAGDELDNGNSLLQRLKEQFAEVLGDAINIPGFEFEKQVAVYAAMGLNFDNVYLYVRGHSLYNCLVSIGKKICSGTGIDFEQNVLKSTLAYGHYEEISKIQRDIACLKNLRKEL